MFNDQYGLTKAVLEGRKTMTRRIIRAPKKMDGEDVNGFSIVTRPGSDEIFEVMALNEEGAMINNILPKFKVGEDVAVAQNLRDMGYNPRDTKHKPGEIWGLDHSPAWTNKMFVSASECIHQIRITNILVERLQDISDEDCLREGIWEEDSGVSITVSGCEYDYPCFRFEGSDMFASPREAFAALIDKVSGRGTWESNPYCFCYEFELIK